MAFWAMVCDAVCSRVGSEIAQPLFWQTKTTGTFQTAAKFTASWKSPSEVAPSPKKQTTAVSGSPRSRAA